MTVTIKHHAGSEPSSVGTSSTTQGTRQEFRRDIQGLRAIAVLAVVLYHCDVEVMSGGFTGVDVFFVISGFLISGKLLTESERGRINIAGFYAARIRRLFLPAAIVTVSTLALARTIGVSFQVKETALDALAAITGLTNLWLIHGKLDYLQDQTIKSPFTHYWSLAVEEQFYLVWPLLISLVAFVCSRRRSFFRPVVTLTFFTIFAVSLALSITITATNPVVAYLAPHTRAWELALGGLTFLISQRIGASGSSSPLIASTRTAIGVLGIVAVTATFVVFTADTPFPSYFALIPTLGTAAVILSGPLHCQWSPLRLLHNPVAQFVGTHSYGWYLWHWPLIVFVPELFSDSTSSWLLIQASLIGLWLAFLTHYQVERPSTYARFSTRRWFSIGAAGMAFTIMLSALVYVTAPTFTGSGKAAQNVALDGNATKALQKSIIDSLQQPEVPENLTPAIDKARADVPPTLADNCHLNYLETVTSDCIYGDKSAARTVVLFGDSHAEQWQPALAKAAEDSHIKLVSWTKAACPIADLTLVDQSLGRRYVECEQWRRERIAAINTMRPDLVVMSQSDQVPADSLSDDDWATRTARAIIDFQEAGIPVVYLLDTAYAGHDVAQCLSYNLQYRQACSFSLAEKSPYPKRSSYVKNALQASGISVVDPIPWMCSAGKCPAIVGNTLIYRDKSHITTTYSTYLSPLLSPIVEAR